MRDLVGDLQGVSGASLEKLLKPLWDRMAGAPVQTNGLNLQGAPISGALDALWPDGSASEASSDKDFFEGKEKKLRNDIRHTRKAAPHVTHLRMFSTREMGPTARTRQDKRRHRYARLGFTIEVHAGQDIAEYIVRECLLDDALVRRISPILPNLERISEQHAASQQLPELDQGFRGRDAELGDVADRLKTERCVVVSGMGGIGKSDFANALAHRVRDRFEQVFWIDAAALTHVTQLGAFDIRANGYELNVLGIMQSQSALVILDNVTVDLDLDALAARCGPRSNVLLTSQARWGPAPVELGDLERADAEAILSEGVPSACPDAIVDQILGAIGAHPLLLRILNRVAREAGASWDEVAGECAHLPDALDDRRQTVAARIVRRNLAALGARLAPFLWMRSAAIDAGLLRHMIGFTGMSELARWAFLARSGSRDVRLHDIVYACVLSLAGEIHLDPAQLKDQLEAYLRRGIDPKDIHFVRVSRRHKALLSTLLTAAPGPGIIRYAYLHGAAARDLDAALIGDPGADAASDPAGPPREWVLSIVEAIESAYRHRRDHGDKDGAKRELDARLGLFDVLEHRPGLDAESMVTIKHHRAKSLLKLGRVADAESGFEAIVADHPDAFGSKLQLARLLEGDPDRAKMLVFDIIEAEQSEPGSVQISTVIETLATFRRRHLSKFGREMTGRFGPFMAQMIKAAAWSGEAQPVRAFAAVGPDWSYTEPALFLEVFEEIDLGSPDAAEDDDERVAVGRIYVAAHKMYARDGRTTDADAALARALEFFASVGKVTPFASSQYADALILGGQPDRAGEVLDGIPADRRDEFWHLRRAESLQGSDAAGALRQIDGGLAAVRDSKYRATFLARKAELLRAVGDPQADATLADAIASCENDRFRQELEERQAKWNAGRA